jgi:hypothetical protein
MGTAMDKSVAKERILLAVMAGQASAHDAAAAAVGARLEEQARGGWAPRPVVVEPAPVSLLSRLKAAFAA